MLELILIIALMLNPPALPRVQFYSVQQRTRSKVLQEMPKTPGYYPTTEEWWALSMNDREWNYYYGQ